MGKKVSGWSVLSLTGLQSPGGISSPCMFPCMETAFPSITRCLAHTVHALSVATLVGQIRTLLTAGPGPVHECKHRGVYFVSPSAWAEGRNIADLCRQDFCSSSCTLQQRSGVHWVLMGLAGWQLQQLGAVGYLSTSQACSFSTDSYS